MSRYAEGQAAHAAGTSFTENPHASGTDMTDWAAGWSDAQAQVTTTSAGATETAESAVTDESPGAPGSAAPEGTPNAAVASTDETKETSETKEVVAPEETKEVVATEVLDAMGEAGIERIMDLLTDPPVDDVAPGTLPEHGEVPDDLGEWLEAWKAPLAFVTVDVAINAVKSRISGTSRGALKELYRNMSPAAMVAAMNGNAAVISEFADQRVAEAGLISSIQASLTQKAAGFLLNALLLV